MANNGPFPRPVSRTRIVGGGAHAFGVCCTASITPVCLSGKALLGDHRARERFADGCVHALGIAASIAAMTVLLVVALLVEPGLTTVALSVYGAGMVTMFAFSAAYNLNSHPGWEEALRRLDHAAIYVMIAGTYTPFALIAMGGAWGYGLLAVVWAIAGGGIVLQNVAPRRLRRLRFPLYLVQAWAVLAALEPLTAAVSVRVLTLLLIGGALYMIGVMFHLWRRLPYHNAIWHAFVLAAAGCHYAAVIDAVIA